MPRLRFWSTTESTTPPPEREPQIEVAPEATGFNPPPPRKVTVASGSDRTHRLMQRRDEIEAALEQQTALVADEIRWADRVAPVNQAIENVEAELNAILPTTSQPYVKPPDFTVHIVNIQPDPPAQVWLKIDGQIVVYEEEVDWAERGTSVVRGELERKGDPIPGLPHTDPELLASSLFSLATDMRDKSLAGEQTPASVASTQLLTRCPVCGGARIWNGVCLDCEARHQRTRALAEERKRLLDQRNDILNERESLIEEIPMIKRRIADLNHQIETSKLPRP